MFFLNQRPSQRMRLDGVPESCSSFSRTNILKGRRKGPLYLCIHTQNTPIPFSIINSVLKLQIASLPALDL